MSDFKAYRLPFGGIALEPLTEDGKALLEGFEWEDSVFRHPDACMAGLPENAVGFEPCIVSEIVAEIREQGLTSTAG